MCRTYKRIASLILLAFLGHEAWASDLAVPVSVQLPLFRKIWQLDRNFPPQAHLIVAVLYQETYASSAVVKSQVMNWVDDKGMHLNAIAVAIDGPEGLDVLRSVRANVFYVAPLRAADIRAISTIARARHIRTITGVPRYVEDGLGVAVDVRDDRPLIVINVAASIEEGASFPAQLLQLARLIGVH